MDTIVERNQDEACARLERLSAGLSSELIGVSPTDVPGAIEDALRRLGEALDLDQAAFIELVDGTTPTAQGQWARPGADPIDGDGETASLPDLVQRLRPDGKP